MAGGIVRFTYHGDYGIVVFWEQKRRAHIPEGTASRGGARRVPVVASNLCVLPDELVKASSEGVPRRTMIAFAPFTDEARHVASFG